MNCYPGNLRKFFFHAIFERANHIMHIGNRQVRPTSRSGRKPKFCGLTGGHGLHGNQQAHDIPRKVNSNSFPRRGRDPSFLQRCARHGQFPFPAARCECSLRRRARQTYPERPAASLEFRSRDRLRRDELRADSSAPPLPRCSSINNRPSSSCAVNSWIARPLR